uniref:Transmembrane protein n=1 Tax=Chromera velia CCMP2878 TaxID=1169474 RepID=A0A0G4HCP8_9ALVE|eukprot:Cvel_936.t1-p1 / transcript=Cvel_936.t1 / gene=Cvel_936 / organism=Chromera_velia_CCMP2878 / gene_product=hypothetical protein / transcript_product=hypothetical protein / location=Cvel_scaffold30:588-6463(-) / protein_length=541 / sequence_SO=supercontig / SO=protein_coding / is_pseudo=false
MLYIPSAVRLGVLTALCILLSLFGPLRAFTFPDDCGAATGQDEATGGASCKAAFFITAVTNIIDENSEFSASYWLCAVCQPAVCFMDEIEFVNRCVSCGTFWADFNLHNFPFDHQTLPLVLEGLKSDTDIFFNDDPKSSGILTEAQVDRGWKLGDLRGETVRRVWNTDFGASDWILDEQEVSSYSRLRVEIPTSRTNVNAMIRAIAAVSVATVFCFGLSNLSVSSWPQLAVDFIHLLCLEAVFSLFTFAVLFHILHSGADIVLLTLYFVLHGIAFLSILIIFFTPLGVRLGISKPFHADLAGKPEPDEGWKHFSRALSRNSKHQHQTSSRRMIPIGFLRYGGQEEGEMDRGGAGLKKSAEVSQSEVERVKRGDLRRSGSGSCVPIAMDVFNEGGVGDLEWACGVDGKGGPGRSRGAGQSRLTGTEAEPSQLRGDHDPIARLVGVTKEKSEESRQVPSGKEKANPATQAEGVEDFRQQPNSPGRPRSASSGSYRGGDDRPPPPQRPRYPMKSYEDVSRGRGQRHSDFEEDDDADFDFDGGAF